ncbi:MAG: glycosyltransferase family 4 protein [Actinomycetota bacterium]
MTRSFFVTPVLPFPTSGGADLRAWNIIQGLARLGPVSVFALADRPTTTPPLDDLLRWEASPALSPAEVGTRHQRMWAAPKPGTRLSDAYDDPQTESLLADALEADRPDVVVMDALSGGGYLPVVERYRSSADPTVRVVHNSHNVEATLARDIADAEKVMPLRVLRKLLATSTEAAERELLDASDALWVCSDTDARGFVEHYDYDRPIAVVPNVVDVESYDEQYAGRDANPGSGMVFPATFSYPPNEVGARFLLDELTPRLPDVPLTLAGAGPPPSLVDDAAGRARVTGAIPDMRPELAAAAVMVVPLFEGGGTRLKVLEGFAAGLPVVATTKAVEGLDVVDGEHVLIADSPDEFASAVQRATDAGTAARLRLAGRTLVEADYSVSAVGSKLAAALA